MTNSKATERPQYIIKKAQTRKKIFFVKTVSYTEALDEKRHLIF